MLLGHRNDQLALKRIDAMFIAMSVVWTGYFSVGTTARTLRFDGHHCGILCVAFRLSIAASDVVTLKFNGLSAPVVLSKYHSFQQ